MTERLPQLLVIVLAGMAGISLVMLPYDTVGGTVLIGALLVIASVVLLPRLAPREERRFLQTVLLLALVAKMLATAMRLFMNDVVYGGGDLNRYDGAGEPIANRIRSGDFSAITDNLGIGTEFTEVLSGLVQTVLGSSFIGIFFLSGFLGFLAAVLFYRAFCIAFPNGDRRLYALLIFFYPAVLYWPTGFGKDVIAFLMLGLAVYGTAQFIIRARLSGFVLAVIGLFLMFMVRPEVGLIASIAFITAFVLRRPSTNRRAFILQLLGVPLVLVAGFIFISQATSFLGIESLSLNSALMLVTEQSAQIFDEGRSGSNFRPPEVGTPTWIPEAFLTVLFRPWPWEVHNIPALVQSFDGLMLAAIVFFSRGRLFRSFRQQRRNPIIVFSFVMMLMSVIALATLGNFGLLARQRVIVLPLLFFMISAAEAVRKRRKSAEPKRQAETRPQQRLASGAAGHYR